MQKMTLKKLFSCAELTSEQCLAFKTRNTNNHYYELAEGFYLYIPSPVNEARGFCRRFIYLQDGKRRPIKSGAVLLTPSNSPIEYAYRKACELCGIEPNAEILERYAAKNAPYKVEPKPTTPTLNLKDGFKVLAEATKDITQPTTADQIAQMRLKNEREQCREQIRQTAQRVERIENRLNDLTTLLSGFINRFKGL